MPKQCCCRCYRCGPCSVGHKSARSFNRLCWTGAQALHQLCRFHHILTMLSIVKSSHRNCCSDLFTYPACSPLHTFPCSVPTNQNIGPTDGGRTNAQVTYNKHRGRIQPGDSRSWLHKNQQTTQCFVSCTDCSCVPGKTHDSPPLSPSSPGTTTCCPCCAPANGRGPPACCAWPPAPPALRHE